MGLKYAALTMMDRRKRMISFLGWSILNFRNFHVMSRNMFALENRVFSIISKSVMCFFLEVCYSKKHDIHIDRKSYCCEKMYCIGEGVLSCKQNVKV